MKKFLTLSLVALLSMSASNAVNAAIEKGNPVGIYYHNGETNVVNLNDREIKLRDNYTALFLNGTLITDYEVIIRNDRSLVPVRLISEELGATVDWDGENRIVTIKKDGKNILLAIDNNKVMVNNKEFALDYPAIIYNDSTYVPLRFIAENFDATVDYSSALGNDFERFPDMNLPIAPVNSIVGRFPNIMIDEKYDDSQKISKDDAIKNAKQQCLEGLDNFKITMRENLVSAGEPADRLDSDFNFIEEKINGMLHVGETARYYKFSTGVYDILYDKYNNNMFFIIYQDSTTVKKFDVNDPHLYIAGFIVG